MPLEWLGARSREPSLPELIARRKYGRAIEVLTEQLRRETPTTQARLQLADLMVQAGRVREAVPVFLELADEFAREGFVAKAIAVVKRVGRLDPEQQIDERLEGLVRTQRRVALDSGVVTARRPTTVPLFDIEEIPDHGPEIELFEVPPEPDPLPEFPPESPPEIEPEIEPDVEPEIQLEPEPEIELEAALEVDPEVELAAAPHTAPEAEPDVAALLEPDPTEPDLAEPDLAEPDLADLADLAESEATPEAAGAGVRDRIRNAFKRFLRSVPQPEAEAEASGDAPEAAEPPEEPIEVETSELAYGGDAPPDDEPGDGVSEDAFRGQLLDVIQGALHQPSAPAPAPADAPVPANRLLATPLFGGLDEQELLAVVRGLDLRTCRAGDVILTEGERGAPSLFVISSGQAKVFVHGPSGRNVQLGLLEEGDFFGEMSGLSGRPRAATITAAEDCELLELAKPQMDEIAKRHPRVREQLENHFVERASSPEAAAVRAVPLSDDSGDRASAVLAAHFGESSWDPRMRLRLARLLVQSGKEEQAIPVLIALADELSRGGHTAKAVAVIKKVEQIQNRHLREIQLAPLRRPPAEAVPPADGEAPAAEPDRGAFQSWLVEMVRDKVEPALPAPRPAPPIGYDGLQSSPLFAGFSEEELVALFRSFRLRLAAPGDVVVTEGERGEGLFVLCSGRVRVWVRDPQGRNVELCELSDGAFFGEISALSGRPRSATVCAVGACELLELGRRALESLSRERPRVRRVLEEFVAARTASEDAARIRGRASAREGE